MTDFKQIDSQLDSIKEQLWNPSPANAAHIPAQELDHDFEEEIKEEDNPLSLDDLATPIEQDQDRDQDDIQPESTPIKQQPTSYGLASLSDGKNGSSAPQPRRYNFQMAQNREVNQPIQPTHDDSPLKMAPVPAQPDMCPLNQGLSSEKKAEAYLHNLGSGQQRQVQIKKLVLPNSQVSSLPSVLQHALSNASSAH